MDLVERLPPVTERVCHSDTVTKTTQVWANLTSGLATTIKAKTNKSLAPTAIFGPDYFETALLQVLSSCVANGPKLATFYTASYFSVFMDVFCKDGDILYHS